MKRQRDEYEQGWQYAVLNSASRRNPNDMAVDQPSGNSWTPEVAYSHSQQNFVRTMHRVIEEADVVLFVLDARDPEGCRSYAIEQEIRRREVEGKRFIFLLNKSDLVPKSNVEAWLRYLRHFAPTVAFRASTQQQRSNISSKSTVRLIHVLKSFKQVSRTLVVGVVGYPNVGKSSVINSLKRSKVGVPGHILYYYASKAKVQGYKVCAVGAEPGWTKQMQTIQVERGIKLLDSPGVIFERNCLNNQTLVLRNVIKMADIADPVSVASLIYGRVTSNEMCKIYNIPQQEHPDFHQFIVQLALSSGRLLKAGVADVNSASRVIIQDWNSHKLPFYSEIPKFDNSGVNGYGGNDDLGETMIITNEFAPAFTLDARLDAESQVEAERMSRDPQESDGEWKQETNSAVIGKKQSFKKRRRRPVVDHETASMAISNPMSRKSQKVLKSRARKIARKRESSTKPWGV